MATKGRMTPEEIEEAWRIYFTTGTFPENITLPWYRSKRLRAFYRRLPDNPRCRMCHFPFKGIGGTMMRHMFGVVPSPKNPQICNECEQFAEAYHGGAEIELTILFADVRGSTQLAEEMNPTEFSKLINRFFNTATKAIFNNGGMVEKLIGDAVTGFYTSGFSGPSHARIAVDAARQILRDTGHHQPSGPWIPVGIGIHTGLAYIGSVYSDSGLTDFAVLGDTINIGARLSSLAAAGEIHISHATAEAAGVDSSSVEIHQQPLKGRHEPIEVWVLHAD